MSPPKWLPPLNSHGEYLVSAAASQHEFPRNNPTLVQRMFLISTNVSVTFYPNSCNSQEKPFKGMSMHTDFSVPCFKLTSPRLFKQTISQMLDLMLIPFELNHLAFWRVSHLNGDEVIEEDVAGDLIADNIKDFACCVRGQHYNSGYNILPIKLSIKKMVGIPDAQLKAWKFWYHENLRNNPRFRKEYKNAINRPRSNQELMYGENPELDAAKTSAILNPGRRMDGVYFVLFRIFVVSFIYMYLLLNKVS